MAGVGTGTPIVKLYHEKSMILPDVSRVLACLYEKDVKFDAQKASYKSLLRLQASTHAPVPFYDGPTFLEESREICRYIAQTYEHHGYPYLLGKDALERASIEQWLHHEEHTFNPPSRALFCHLAFPLDQEDDLEMQKAKLDEVLEVYEQRLSDNEFLAGDKFTLADLVHLPNSHYIKTSGKFVYLYDSRKNVQRWWDEIFTRDCWKQVLSYMTKVEQDNKMEELEKQKQQQEWQREYHTATGRRIRLDSRKSTRTKSQTILVPPPDTASASPMAPQAEQPPPAESLSEKAPVSSSRSTTHKLLASPSKQSTTFFTPHQEIPSDSAQSSQRRSTSSTPSLGTFPTTADKPPRIHTDMSSVGDVSVPSDTTETDLPARPMLSSSKEVGTYIEPTPQKPPASLDKFSESDGPSSGASHSQTSPRVAKEDSDRLHTSDLYKIDRKSTGVYPEEEESMSYTAHTSEATYGKYTTRGATDSSPNKLHSTEAHQMLQAEKWHAATAGLHNLQGGIDNSMPSRQVKPSKDVQEYPSQDSEQVSIRPVAQEPLSMDSQLVQGPEVTAKTPHTDQTMGVSSPDWQHAADARRISKDEASSDRRIKGAHLPKHATDEDAQALQFQTAHDDSRDTTQRAREIASAPRGTRDQDAHDSRQGITIYDSAPSRLQPMDASHEAPLPSKKATSVSPHAAAHIPTGYQGAQEFIQQGRERPKPRPVVPYDVQGSTEEEKMAESPPSKAQILGSRGLDVSAPKEVLNEDGYDVTGPLQTRYTDDQDDWMQARDSTTSRHMNQDAIDETKMADSEPFKAHKLDSQQAIPQKQPPAEEPRFAASTFNRRYFDDQDGTKKSKYTASIPRRMGAQDSIEETKAGKSALPREQPFLQAATPPSKQAEAKDARGLTPLSQEGYAGPQAVSKQLRDPSSISRRMKAQDARVTFVESKADDSTSTREHPSDAWQSKDPLPEHKAYDAHSSTSPFQDTTMKSEDTIPQQMRGQGAKETKLSDSASPQVQPLDYQKSDSHLQKQEEIEDPHGSISPHKNRYADVEDMTKYPGEKMFGEDAQYGSKETKALDSTIFRGRAHPQDTHQAAIPPPRLAAAKESPGVTPLFPTRYPTPEDTSRQPGRTASTPTEKAVQDGRDAFRESKSVDYTSSRQQPSDYRRAAASLPKQEAADSRSTTVSFQRRYPDIEDTTKEPRDKQKEKVREEAQDGFEETKALDSSRFRGRAQPQDTQRAAITPSNLDAAKDAPVATPLPPTRYPTGEDTSRQPTRTASTPTEKAVRDGRDAFTESKNFDSTPSREQPSGVLRAAASLPKQEAADSRSTTMPFQRRYPDIEDTTKEQRDKLKETLGDDAQDGFEETKALDSSIFRGRAQHQDTHRAAITPSKLEGAKDALGVTPLAPTRYPTAEDTSKQSTRTASTPSEKAVQYGRDAFIESKSVDSTSSREQPSDVWQAAASLPKQEAADSRSTTMPFQRRYRDIEDTTKEPRDMPKETVGQDVQDTYEETETTDSVLFTKQPSDMPRAAITSSKKAASEDAPSVSPPSPTRYPSAKDTSKQSVRPQDSRDVFREQEAVDSTSSPGPSDSLRASASLPNQEVDGTRRTTIPFQKRDPELQNSSKPVKDSISTSWEMAAQDAQDTFEETKVPDSAAFSMPEMDSRRTDAEAQAEAQDTWDGGSRSRDTWGKGRKSRETISARKEMVARDAEDMSGETKTDDFTSRGQSPELLQASSQSRQAVPDNALGATKGTKVSLTNETIQSPDVKDTIKKSRASEETRGPVSSLDRVQSFGSHDTQHANEESRRPAADQREDVSTQFQSDAQDVLKESKSSFTDQRGMGSSHSQAESGKGTRATTRGKALSTEALRETPKGSEASAPTIQRTYSGDPAVVEKTSSADQKADDSIPKHQPAPGSPSASHEKQSASAPRSENLRDDYGTEYPMKKDIVDDQKEVPPLSIQGPTSRVQHASETSQEAAPDEDVSMKSTIEQWWRASKTLPDGTPISGDDVTGLSTGDQTPTPMDQDAIRSTQIANGITERSVKQTAEPPAPVAPQTLFHQQARPSAPITKEVQASDNQGAISKIQQVSPDNHPTDYSAVPHVAAQEQVSHAPQTSPGREGITPVQREMDSPISDALPASAKVQEPAPDESTMPFVSSVKQGSHVGRDVEPHKGPLPDSYGAVVDKATTKSLSWQARSLEASPDSTPTHGYVHPTSRDEPAILPGQRAQSSVTQEPTHPGALDSASNRDLIADSLVGPKKLKQHSTDQEDISFAANQTSDMGTQPDSSLDNIAPAEQKSDLSDQDPSHSAQETVLAAAERTKALPKPIEQETLDSRKPPTPDTQYASQIIPSQEKVAPDVPSQEKVSQAELSLKPHEGSTPHTHGSIVDEKKTRPLASLTKSSNDVLDLTPAGADVHPTSSNEPHRSALPVQETQTPYATQTPPRFVSHESVRTEDIRADANGKVQSVKPLASPDAPHATSPGEVAISEQKLASAGRDSSRSAQFPSSDEPRNEEIKDSDHSAPDQAKDLQTTFGQPDISPAPGTSESSYSDVYDGARKVDPDYQPIDKSIPSQEQVQQVTPKDQRIDGSIPSHEQVPYVGHTPGPHEGPLSDSHGAIVEEPMTHIIGPTSALGTQHDHDLDQGKELPSSAKSRKGVAEADETKAKQMTFGQPAAVASEATRSVTDQGAQQPQRPAKIESPPSFETMKNYEYTQNVSDATLDKNKSSGKPSADQEVMSPKVVPASLDPQHVTVPDDEQKIAKRDLTRSAQPPLSAETTKEKAVVDASDQAKASETIVDREAEEHGSLSEGSTTDSRGAVTDEKSTTSTSGHEKGLDASVFTATHDDVHPQTVRNWPEHETQPPASTQRAFVKASGKAKSTNQEDMKPMASQASILDTQHGTIGDKPIARSLHDQGAQSPELTHAQQPPESPPHSASQHDVPTDVLDKTKMTKPTSTNQEGMSPTAGPRSTLESQPDGTLAAEVVHDEKKSTLSDQESSRATQPLSSVERSKEDTNVSAADPPEVTHTIFHQKARSSSPVTREIQTPDSLGAISKIQGFSPDNQSTDYSAVSPVPTKEQVPHAPQTSPDQEGITPARGEMDSPLPDAQLAPDAPQDEGSPHSAQLPPPVESSQEESQIALDGQTVLPQSSAVQESTPSSAGPRESSSSDSPHSSVENRESAPNVAKPLPPATDMMDRAQPSSEPSLEVSSDKKTTVPQDGQANNLSYVSPSVTASQVVGRSENGSGTEALSGETTPSNSPEKSEGTPTEEISKQQPQTDLSSIKSSKDDNKVPNGVGASVSSAPGDNQPSPPKESTEVTEEGMNQQKAYQANVQSPQDRKEQVEETREQNTGTGETDEASVQSPRGRKEQVGETGERNTETGETYQATARSRRDGKELGDETEEQDTRTGEAYQDAPAAEAPQGKGSPHYAQLPPPVELSQKESQIAKDGQTVLPQSSAVQESTPSSAGPRESSSSDSPYYSVENQESAPNVAKPVPPMTDMMDRAQPSSGPSLEVSSDEKTTVPQDGQANKLSNVSPSVTASQVVGRSEDGSGTEALSGETASSNSPEKSEGTPTKEISRQQPQTDLSSIKSSKDDNKEANGAGASVSSAPGDNQPSPPNESTEVTEEGMNQEKAYQANVQSPQDRKEQVEETGEQNTGTGETDEASVQSPWGSKEQVKETGERNTETGETYQATVQSRREGKELADETEEQDTRTGEAYQDAPAPEAPQDKGSPHSAQLPPPVKSSQEESQIGKDGQTVLPQSSAVQESTPSSAGPRESSSSDSPHSSVENQESAPNATKPLPPATDIMDRAQPSSGPSLEVSSDEKTTVPQDGQANNLSYVSPSVTANQVVGRSEDGSGTEALSGETTPSNSPEKSEGTPTEEISKQQPQTDLSSIKSSKDDNKVPNGVGASVSSAPGDNQPSPPKESTEVTEEGMNQQKAYQANVQSPQDRKEQVEETGEQNTGTGETDEASVQSPRGGKEQVEETGERNTETGETYQATTRSRRDGKELGDETEEQDTRTGEAYQDAPAPEAPQGKGSPHYAQLPPPVELSQKESQIAKDGQTVLPQSSAVQESTPSSAGPRESSSSDSPYYSVENQESAPNVAKPVPPMTDMMDRAQPSSGPSLGVSSDEETTVPQDGQANNLSYVSPSVTASKVVGRSEDGSGTEALSGETASSNSPEKSEGTPTKEISRQQSQTDLSSIKSSKDDNKEANGAGASVSSAPGDNQPSPPKESTEVTEEGMNQQKAYQANVQSPQDRKEQVGETGEQNSGTGGTEKTNLHESMEVTEEISKKQKQIDQSSSKSPKDVNKEANGVTASISAASGGMQSSEPKGSMGVAGDLSKLQQQTDQSSTKLSKDDNKESDGVSASIPAIPGGKPSPPKESMPVTEEARNLQKSYQQSPQDIKEQVEKTKEQNTRTGEAYEQSPQDSKEQVEETKEQATRTGDPEKTHLQKNVNQMNNVTSQEEVLDRSGKQASGVQLLDSVVSKSTKDTSSGIQTYNKSENSSGTSEEYKQQLQAKDNTQDEEIETPASEIEHPKERDPQDNSNRSISSQSQAQASDISEGETSSTEDMNSSRKPDGSTNDTKPGDTEDNPSR